ncbi:hypothetical protein NIES3275_08390 [Microchaete diplosiphon NIES-3275]|nr:hypothetical protein NIES3275_08390 [Microchaete diplosiphon NIES-3275]
MPSKSELFSILQYYQNFANFIAIGVGKISFNLLYLSVCVIHAVMHIMHLSNLIYYSTYVE